MSIKVNDIVDARVGSFIVISLHTISNEPYARLKSYDKINKKSGRGELTLPVSILTAG